MPEIEIIESPVLFIPNSIWRIIDILFPPFCCTCGKIGYEICPDCFSEIETTPKYSICSVCGRILDVEKKCPICEKASPLFDQARSWGIYSGPLKHILQKIKYQRGFGLIEYLAKPIIACIDAWGIVPDIIIPIPLGKNREKTRGYNQSHLIADPIAKHFNIPLEKRALIRTRETRTQVGLNLTERNKNIRDAFEADPAIINNKSILLIDDIATTCATLNESARILKLSGAKEVFCFTVAHTRKPTN